MATLYPYTFNNMTRSRAETVDRSNQILMDNKFSDHILTSYFSDNDRGDNGDSGLNFRKISISLNGFKIFIQTRTPRTRHLK